ncbi:MAG: class 1 fructose-bisphosphatase [Nitrospiraceae bacterium]|nr:class 1 fructose-bisphosphatase [Nitrospiraceae bacterium]
MNNIGTPLTLFLREGQQGHPEATNEFTILLSQISLAGKMISREMSRAGLANVLGVTGDINVHGEVVKKMDVYANNAFKQAFQHGAQVIAMVTEEDENPVVFQENQSSGRYVVYLDPLDGSSNIDVNGSVGSIFSIHRLNDVASLPTNPDLLKKGIDQAAAGYILYGSSTMLVYSCGKGVHGFTLDPASGEFLLSHENMKIPSRGHTYSVNEGNYQKWPAPTQRYIDHLHKPIPDDGRPYSSRYIGALVADVHRTLLTGGIYLYPGEAKNPEGKIRLLYESSPMGYVVEQAGGKASTGTKRILDIQPTTIHQRTPIFIGSYDDVSLAETFMRDGKEDKK